MSDQDWIEHNGGPCPVAADVLVDVIFHTGQWESGLAGQFIWYGEQCADVTHWRPAILPPRRLASPPAEAGSARFVTGPCPFCGGTVDASSDGYHACPHASPAEAGPVGEHKITWSPKAVFWDGEKFVTVPISYGPPPARLARDMTIRERMAMAAMQGFLAANKPGIDEKGFVLDVAPYAKAAVIAADALLAALGEKGDE